MWKGAAAILKHMLDIINIKPTKTPIGIGVPDEYLLYISSIKEKFVVPVKP